MPWTSGTEDDLVWEEEENLSQVEEELDCDVHDDRIILPNSGTGTL